MQDLIGKTVIFQTKRTGLINKTLIPLFPEHTFSAIITSIVGDYAFIKNIKILFNGGNCNNNYGSKVTLFARDKLYYSDRDIYQNNENYDSSIKISNNIYFNIYIYRQNTNLLYSIKSYNLFPNLYDFCFYKLSTLEIEFIRKLLIT